MVAVADSEYFNDMEMEARAIIVSLMETNRIISDFDGSHLHLQEYHGRLLQQNGELHNVLARLRGLHDGCRLVEFIGITTKSYEFLHALLTIIDVTRNLTYQNDVTFSNHNGRDGASGSRAQDNSQITAAFLARFLDQSSIFHHCLFAPRRLLKDSIDPINLTNKLMFFLN